MIVDRYDKDYNCETISVDPKDIKSLTKNYIYYEKIQSKPKVGFAKPKVNSVKVKPFFDIDIYDIKPEVICDKNFHPLVTRYMNYYKELFQLIFKDADIAISSSHIHDKGECKKLSFHYVINNYEYELNELYEFIMNHPILSMDDNIDKTIYTPRPSHYKVNFLGHDNIYFRLLYSYKSHKDKRMKYPHNYDNDLEKHIVSSI